jgi:hypothetical protein
MDPNSILHSGVVTITNISDWEFDGRFGTYGAYGTEKQSLNHFKFSPIDRADRIDPLSDTWTSGSGLRHATSLRSPRLELASWSSRYVEDGDFCSAPPSKGVALSQAPAIPLDLGASPLRQVQFIKDAPNCNVACDGKDSPYCLGASASEGDAAQLFDRLNRLRALATSTGGNGTLSKASIMRIFGLGTDPCNRRDLLP